MRILKDCTRVSIFLPLNETTLPKISKIITELRDRFKGITHSRLTYPTEFIGLYVEEREGKITIYEDNIVWLIVDVNLEEIPDIEKYFLKFKSLKEAELHEGEIWITCHPVSRFISTLNK